MTENSDTGQTQSSASYLLLLVVVVLTPVILTWLISATNQDDADFDQLLNAGKAHYEAGRAQQAINAFADRMGTTEKADKAFPLAEEVVRTGVRGRVRSGQTRMPPAELSDGRTRGAGTPLRGMRTAPNRGEALGRGRAQEVPLLPARSTSKLPFPGPGT